MASSKPLIWAQLVHLGYNMWADREAPEWNIEYTAAQQTMRFDMSLWDDLMKYFTEVGVNTVVIDLGEGLKYESHPELAVDGSWTGAQLRKKLAEMRALGLTPIPKLNFSTCHDTWLGDYSRCVSSKIYYRVCSDIIAEVCELFDKPALFHLGMDEENQPNQQFYAYSVCRQMELWWHDLYFLAEQAEKGGARPWIWSDYVWDNHDVFYAKMPKSILQSNWYYGHKFTTDITAVKAYNELEEHGYDQIPTGSNWSDPQNFEKTVRYCKDVIAPERLKGFFQTVWKPTVERRRWRHFEGASEVGYGKRAFEE
ncbi:MAG TPA: Tat pathway signal protein [Candidatus Latescibacteria bacterium]|nr:Tat pathway signal protein [Candidatus Latescibacterota bacterium]